MKRAAWLCLVLAGAACGGGGNAGDRNAQDVSRVPGVLGVSTSVATTRPFPHVVSAIGTVTPRPDRFAALAPPGQTRVARIFVVAGQPVAAGEALIEFERAPFDAAAQSAAAALANAERAYARAVRLVQAGVLAQKDSGQAAADLAAAQAAAVTARRAQELSTLRAPLRGVVTRMSAVLGASVDANQTLVEVADPMALDIVFNVSPAEASRIHTGDTATVTSGEGTARGGGESEALGPGVVTSIGVAIDSASRAVAVRARLTVPARALRIGESRTRASGHGRWSHGIPCRNPVRGRCRRDRRDDGRLRCTGQCQNRRRAAVKLFDILSRQQRLVYLVVALLSAAGIWMALRLPSAIYPELQFSRITIVAQGSTLGARQVVFSITRPIEEAVSIVPGVTRVRSHSIRGASEISITFAPGTNMDQALQLVRARVNQVQSALPPNLSIEVEQLTPSLFPIVSYNVEGGEPATLYDLARYEIKPLISRVPGVGRVDVQGSDVRELEVIADPGRLASQGMTYADLADAIRRAITVQAVGRVAQDYRQYLIVTDQEAHAADDIGAVVIRGGLRVRDVASVQLGTEDHVRIIAGDGKPAALINVTRQVGGNTLALADSVARIMATVAPSLPPGVHLKPVYDQAELVREAVRSVRDAMLIGATLAVIVLLVFLRHGRITAISAASIPLTLAITVFIMSMIGQTFNLMTLGAMAIAIGLVIDDAVVITENIARHLRLTTDRLQAIRAAVQELIWPVTTSTLTTVVVFLPLGLLQGVVGQFFAALATTLTVAVLVSLVLALTIIPLLAEQFVTAHEVEPTTTGPLARAQRALDALGSRYERALAAGLHHARRIGALALGFVVAGIILMRLVGTGFLPEMDEGAFVLDYWTPGGTALAETNRQVGIVEQILAATPEISGTSRRTGAELGLFATAQNTGDLVQRPRGQPETGGDQAVRRTARYARSVCAAPRARPGGRHGPRGHVQRRGRAVSRAHDAREPGRGGSHWHDPRGCGKHGERRVARDGSGGDPRGGPAGGRASPRP